MSKHYQGKSMDTAPRNESEFLIRRPCLGVLSGAAGYYWEQASYFEGAFYPSRLESAVDWDDRILDATGWDYLPSGDAK